MVNQAARPVASRSAAAGAAAGVIEGIELRLPEGDVLDPLVQAQCSLAVQLRRASGSIIGRGDELAAIGREIRRPPRASPR